MIFKFQALRAPAWNRNNTRAENRAAFGFFRAAFSHLQKSWVNRLLFQLVVELPGAFALQNHGRNTHRVIPHGEIRHRRPAGQRKDVVPFLNSASMVGKDLSHEHTSVAVVDLHRNFHFFERKDGGIGLRLVARD